jgi:uncharacterized membrane protein YfcA
MPIDVLSGAFLYLAAIAAIAGVLRGYTGFGSAMVMSPLWAIAIGPAQAIATLVVLEVAVSFQLLPRAVRSTDWRLIGLLTISATAAVPLGVWALVTVDPAMIRRVIGLVVLVWAGAMLWGVRYTGRLSSGATLGIGAASGALMGATGLGGPPVLIYLLSTPARAESNRANIIVFFAIVSVYLIGAFAVGGIYVEETWWRALLMAPIFLGSAWIGANLFDKSSDATYRRVALVFLAVVGLATLAI